MERYLYYITQIKKFMTMLEQFKAFIKPLEFLVVVGLCALGVILGGVNLFWGLIIAGGYIAINLLGLATKPTQEVIDEAKDKYGK